MLAEQTITPLTVSYTDDVPVLTPELLTEFKNDLRFATDTKYRGIIEKIHLSPSPDVFTHDDEDLYGPFSENEEVRIWRQEIPDKVLEFVACALDILGNRAAYHLPENLCLNESGKLIDLQGQEIGQEDIAAHYIEAGIDRTLCLSFADYFINSFTTFLSYLPSGSRLKNTTASENLEYVSEANTKFTTHCDEYNQIVWHLSNPGTPYWTDILSLTPAYRTQIGDFAIHGNNVPHRFATSALLPDGSKRPRFFVGYQIS